MAIWGKTNLSDAALKRIEELNNDAEVDELSGIQKRLFAAVIKTKPASAARLGLLKDWPVRETVGENVSDSNYSTAEKMVANDLSSTIVDTVKSGSNINMVIELISKIGDAELDNVVSKCWLSLTKDDDKKSFIIAMSATKCSAMSMSKILLQVFANKELFENNLKVYGQVLYWLESNAVHTLLVPLMVDENSPISLDINYCKAFFTSITVAQRTEALVGFCHTTSKLGELQLQCISVILELPVDSSVVTHLTHLLAAHMNEHSANRLMGKVLLTLITLLSSSTPQNVFQEVSDLAGRFKGPLRFRHKQALANVSKQIQPT